MVTSAEEIALAALREHQEAMGMTFEHPDAPVHAELGYGPDEEFR